MHCSPSATNRYILHKILRCVAFFFVTYTRFMVSFNFISTLTITCWLFLPYIYLFIGAAFDIRPEWTSRGPANVNFLSSDCFFFAFFNLFKLQQINERIIFSCCIDTTVDADVQRSTASVQFSSTRSCQAQFINQ